MVHMLWKMLRQFLDKASYTAVLLLDVYSREMKTSRSKSVKSTHVKKIRDVGISKGF